MSNSLRAAIFLIISTLYHPAILSANESLPATGLVHTFGVFNWIIIVSGVVIVAFVAFLCWTKTLNRKIRKHTLLLSESEKRYRALFERSQNGILFADVNTRKFKYVNPAAGHLLGYSTEELCSMGVDDIHPPDSLDRALTDFKLQAEGKKDFAYAQLCLKKDGSIIYVTISTARVQTEEGDFLVGFFTDVTSRIKSEDVLREREEQLRNLIDQSPLSIQITTPDGKITQVNPAFMKLWGFSQDTLLEIYKKYNVLEDKQVRQLGIMPLIERAYRGEQIMLPPIQYNPVETFQRLDFDKPEGRKRWIQARLYPVKDKNGKIKNIVQIEEDITDQKQAEEELNQAREELLHATRTGTLAEMTAALAHELNHPLGSILNNANAAKRYLEKDPPDLDEIREIISDIISEDRRASDVMQKLRALMKKTHIEFVHLQINSLIEEVIDLTQSELVINNILLSKEFAADLPEINADRVQLQQVFLNLIINAVDAMKDSPLKNLHISTAKQDDSCIIVCLKDTGEGVDEKDIGRLFTPFFTTKKEGLGMGLSVTRTIIKSHDGDIWIENNPDRGACFFISLPIYKENNNA